MSRDIALQREWDSNPRGSRPRLALDLKSGDRLVVVSRRLLERNARASDFDILAALAETAPLHPRDVVHVFKAAVLAATGAELGDDAAVLCLDWRGSTRQGRALGRRIPAASSLERYRAHLLVPKWALW